jgi:hypothetical protein
MSEDEPVIELQCPKCKTTSEYKRKLYTTFGKVRCVCCSATISHTVNRLKIKLQKLRNLSFEPRTKEWAKTIYEEWEYVLRNRDALPTLEPEFRLETCVELLRNGLTAIPGLENGKYERILVIPLIISEGFDPTPFLPANPPKFPSQWELNVFAVHYRLLGKLLEDQELVLHFEFGAVNFVPLRWRIGTIVLTTKRLIVIGTERMFVSDQVRSYIKYPTIEKFHIEAYKIPEKSEWTYEVRPEPHLSSIHVSVDYFYLQDLHQYFQRDSGIECVFRNQNFVNIQPFDIKTPLRVIRSFQAGWDLSTIRASQKELTGEYRVGISLSGEANYEKGVHGPNKRAELFAKALKEQVDPVIDTGSSYL